ncbi:MAG: DUF2752 domain-containing protein [Verrucomicrobiales bacterium]|nr:DUF2752 domain-containing protein [Verrucomicrobiales bacterium]
MNSPSATSGVTKPWLIATVLWFISVAAFTWLNLYQGTSYTICPLKTLTDIPCPGCGGTRAVLALSKGDIAQAFLFNPLTTLLLLLSPAILYAWFNNRQRPIAERWYPKKTFWIIITVLVLANWYFVLKNLP